MDTFLIVLLTVYAVFALLKPIVFVALPYGQRRAMLDRSYAGGASATSGTDPALVALCLVLVGLLVRRGADPVSFLTGLLVGMTLIQVFFHRYSAPLAKAQAPPPPASPIKTMSYAIQAQPGRAWMELVIIAVLLAGSLWGLLGPR